jgi:uncharacterized protein (DUF58 family)
MKQPGGQRPGRIRVEVTANGWIFLALLLAMLLAASNYGNTMAYILCFVVTGQVTIVVGDMRRQLRDFALDELESGTVFAGDALAISALVRNRTLRTKYALALALDGKRRIWSAPFSLAAGTKERIDLHLPTSRRGRFRLPAVCLSSSYPVGFFRVWSLLPQSQDYIVYPRPAGDAPWPAPAVNASAAASGVQATGGDDFTGLRPYRPGLSPRHIDWKAYARGRPLAVKEFSGGGTHEQWFAWTDLPHLGHEERIAQLTRWVLEADQQNVPFGLSLPGQEIAVDGGSHHIRACLHALAVCPTLP